MGTQQNIHNLAEELNGILQNHTAGRLLSDLGRRMYFPKGIIAQSDEAKRLGKNANATIGTAVQNGEPMMLSCLKKYLPGLTPAETVGYAPTAGNPKLREMWKGFLLEKNPSLKNKKISLPVLVPGLTAGISFLADLFLDESCALLTADPYWENYALIVESRRNSSIHQFVMFENGKFRSGYTPYREEAEEICAALTEIAGKGADVLVWCDDAYFGLNYEEGIHNESLFAKLADAHERILAVKIDGPTKEDYAWGFRTGFVTFAAKGMTDALYEALTRKMMGAIRSSVSCAATESQSIILKAFDDPSLEGEKERFKNILQARYNRVKACVAAHRGSPAIEPLPFNSGYFMCLRCIGVDAETVRRELLQKHGIGTVAIDGSHLRVAFSSLEEDKIEFVYDTIYKTAEELAAK